MSDLPASIPIALLRSYKLRITFRDEMQFLDLVAAYGSGEPVRPILVVKWNAGFVIQEGVRRAKAAQKAGLTSINAELARAGSVGRPIGYTIPLDEVRLPWE